MRDAGRHGIIVGRDSYGQGSSREHAAICPMYLGVKAVIAYAIERIHAANLINFGIVPFTFVNKEDYELLPEGTEIVIENLPEKLAKRAFPIIAKANGHEIQLTSKLSDEDIRILLAGGRLNLK